MTTTNDLLARTLLLAALLAFAIWGLAWLAPRLAAGFSERVQQTATTPRKVSL
jgi:hypothetical protein